MYELPISIEVNGVVHAIRNRGDYRMVLDCFNALNDTELSQQERIVSCLVIFLEEITDESQIYLMPAEDLKGIAEKMMLFFNCGQEEQKQSRNYKLIDWKRDESLICSAINNVAGKEIRLEPYIHWWTFMGYYMAIGECSLSTVVSIRYKQSRNEKLEKYENKFVKDNPQYFNWDRRTAAQIEEDEYIRSIWNSE